MNNEPIARLPFDPKDPWYSFVQAYQALPTKSGLNGKVKMIEAHSSYLPAGVKISSTFSDTLEVGRVSIDVDDKKYLRPDLITALAGWEWELLIQGTTRLVFRKSLKLVDGESTMPSALTLILEKLGVEPNQDWGL